MLKAEGSTLIELLLVLLLLSGVIGITLLEEARISHTINSDLTRYRLYGALYSFPRDSACTPGDKINGEKTLHCTKEDRTLRKSSEKIVLYP